MWILARTLLALTFLGAGVARAESLPPCPATPNCVSSESSDPDHQVAALKAGADAASARQALLNALATQPRVTLTHEGETRVEAEFRSLIFRFVDDVIFLIREDGSVDVRSASRVGYSDLGANRRRVEALREALTLP